MADFNRETEKTFEETQVQEWVRLINERGIGYLHGKLDREYAPLGKIAPPIIDPKGFRDIVVFPDEERVRFLKTNNRGILELGGLITNYCARDANYLIIGKPFGEEEKQIAFFYRMFSHKDYTPDARGHHLDVDFLFSLPEEEARELIKAIQDDPLILDEVFREVFPQLTTNLLRIQVNQIKMLDLNEESHCGQFGLAVLSDGTLHWDRPTFRSRTVNREGFFTILSFLEPIGEMPG